MQNLCVGISIILFFVTTATEAKPSNAAAVEGGTFGQIENRNNYEDDEELQSYVGGGGGRFENQPFAISSPPAADPARDRWTQMRMLIKLLTDEMRNRQGQRNYGNSVSMPIRPTSFGKRQIVYRQCFFNPISCF